MDAAIAAGLVLSLVTAVLYGYVGSIMLHRESHGPARRALNMFATWWFSLGGLQLLDAVETGLYGLGVDDLALHTALALLGVLPLVVALWSLLYYLLYLHTGKQGIFWPLTVFYVVVYAYFLYLVVWLDPVGVRFQNWNASIEYSRSLEGPVLASVLALLFVPASIAALLYGSLFFRLKDPVHRYRIALVSGSFILWFGAFPLLGIVSGLNQADWWPALSRGLGLIAPILIIMAYRPPRWVLERLDAKGGAGREA